MSKYMSEECRQCDDFLNPYGCVCISCPIRIDYEAGRAEMAADEECDRLREALWEEERMENE